MAEWLVPRHRSGRISLERTFSKKGPRLFTPPLTYPLCAAQWRDAIGPREGAPQSTQNA